MGSCAHTMVSCSAVCGGSRLRRVGREARCGCRAQPCARACGWSGAGADGIGVRVCGSAGRGVLGIEEFSVTDFVVAEDDGVVGSLDVSFGEVDVVLWEFGEVSAVGVVDFADDFAGDAHDDHAVGDVKAWWDERSGADDAAVSDVGSAHDDGAHSDECVVADTFAVDDGGVSDDDVAADAVGVAVVAVDDGVVLDVCAIADEDGGDVASDDGAVPDADVVAESDVAGDAGGVGDVASVVVAHGHVC